MATKRAETDPRFMVELGSARFDPKSEAARARRLAKSGKQKLAKALGVEAGDVPGGSHDVYLLQFGDDLDSGTVSRLRTEYRLQLTQGPSSLAFVERMDLRTAACVRRDRAVRACILFPPQLKLAGLSSMSDLGPDSLVRVGLFADADIPGLQAGLEAVGLQVIHVDEARHRSGAATVNVRLPSGEALATLAAFSEVQWVGSIPRMIVNNLGAAGVSQGGDAATHTVWAKGLRGEDMVIGVIDDGILDMQSKFLADSGHAGAGPLHRKVVQLRRLLSSSVTTHATEVSGCAVADEDGKPGINAHRGGAWAAKLAFGDGKRAFDASPVSSLPDELAAAANAGAFIHSNSYGINEYTPRPPPYDQVALDADQFTFENEDHLLLVAGTNSSDAGFQGGIVLSKNAVAVNSCRRAPDQDDFHDGKSVLTGDGRRKPDLVAVGEDITTSALHGPDNKPPAVTTPPVSGTSYATPHVAAAAALVRQYFVKGFYPNGKGQAVDAVTPSGALLKAMLLNATVDLTGRGGYPGPLEGWGRLQLDKTLHFDGDKLLLRVWDVRHIEGLERDGATKAFSLDVPAGAKRMKCTLVFTDPPHSTNAADPVVNKVDLEATEPIPGRFVYFGNDFRATGVSRPRDPSEPGFTTPPKLTDLKNNVRQILVQTPLAGQWDLLVRGYKIDQARTPVTAPPLDRSTQGYALVTCVEMN